MSQRPNSVPFTLPIAIGTKTHLTPRSACSPGRTGVRVIRLLMPVCGALETTGWLYLSHARHGDELCQLSSVAGLAGPALHLARQFVDYEPGIHYSQCQMQSGITGINTIRIYNPVKQSQDQDKDGLFIRQWIPELSAMPHALIHTPWLKPALAPDYPPPLVDEKLARKQAAAQIYAIRRTATHRQQADLVITRHASRRDGSMATHRGSRLSQKSAENAAPPEHKQMDLKL